MTDGMLLLLRLGLDRIGARPDRAGDELKIYGRGAVISAEFQRE